MAKCQISVTSALYSGRVIVEGKKNFSQAETLDEILQTCAGAITAILQEFNSVVEQPLKDDAENSEIIKELAAQHLLDIALYNYLADTDRIGAVSKALENIMKSVMKHCEEKRTGGGE